MKFVIDKLGFEEFTRQWQEAYDTLVKAGATTSGLTLLPYQDEAPLIMPTKLGNGTPSNGTNVNGAGHDSNGSPEAQASFNVWRKTNVIAQRQAGFLTAVVKLPSGDMTTEQTYALADFAETYANGNIRTTISQNMIIRWIPETRIYDFYQDLVSQGLGSPGAEGIEDIVSCPGTDTCGLGITSSKGLARGLSELFPAGETPQDLKGVDIKISGCHNSCAQHHIATIGLHGVGKRIGDHIAPVYELHLGGQVNGTAKIAQLIVKVPAKNVPAAIQHLLDYYRKDREAGESLQAFIARMGKAKLKQELIPHTFLPAYAENSEYYFDWEADEEFSVEDLGPGECAGGALEMIDNRMLEAEQELYHARILAEKHQYGIAINKAYRAVIAGAKAILVTEGTDPNTDADTLAEYDRLVMAKGLMPATYRNLTTHLDDLGSKDVSTEFLQRNLDFARGFVEACRTATEEIGQDLKITPVEIGAEQPVEAKAQEAPTAAPISEASVYDLRGVACPMNYVKTKLKMEMMDDGEQLEVWLDAGDPIKNVPTSLRNDGHKILTEEALDGDQQHFKILVEKVEA